MSFVSSFFTTNSAVQLRIGGPGYVGAYDPGALLNGGTAALAQAADGITIPLTSYTPGDITTNPCLVWALQTEDGTALSTAVIQDIAAELLIRSGPGDSSDTAINIAVVNESDLYSATIDGVYLGVRFSGATRNVRWGGILNGTQSAPAEAAATGAIVRASCRWPWHNTSVGRLGIGHHVAGLTAADVLTGQVGGGTAGNITYGNSTMYIMLIPCRTAATAGNVSMTVDSWVRVPRGVALAT